jgi:hypothetical protein
MQIVDLVYLGRESKVGFPISRDRFAIVHIRLRIPLDAAWLLWDGKKIFVNIGLMA